MRKRLSSLAFFTFIALGVLGQDAGTNQPRSAATLVSDSSQLLQYRQRLYNGAAHAGYWSAIEGHAYFIRDWRIGSVVYEGVQFNDVPILYDLYKDNVVIKHYYGMYVLSLVSSRVQSFTIPGHRFERITPSSPDDKIREGFYEVLFDGSIKVLAKRIKTLREYISTSLEYEFIEESHYFVYKDNTYHPIKKESQLLELFGAQRSQVKQHTKKAGFSFKKQREQYIVRAAEYFESIKK